MIIESNNIYTLKTFTVDSKFTGCQCYDDCCCKKEFVEESFSLYQVKRKTGRGKRTVHNTLDEAHKRCEELNNLFDEGYLK